MRDVPRRQRARTRRRRFRNIHRRERRSANANTRADGLRRSRHPGRGHRHRRTSALPVPPTAPPNHSRSLSTAPQPRRGRSRSNSRSCRGCGSSRHVRHTTTISCAGSAQTYSDADCGLKIPAANIGHACARIRSKPIALDASARICADALSASSSSSVPKVYTSVFGISGFPREDVQTKATIAYTTLREAMQFGGQGERLSRQRPRRRGGFAVHVHVCGVAGGREE